MDVHPRAGVTAVSGRQAIWFAIALAGVIAPYLLLATYTYPGADDLTFAAATLRDGYWTSFRDQFLHWSGRFASTLLDLGGPMVWGTLGLYRTVSAVIIAGTVVAAYAVARAIAADDWSRSRTIAAALCLTALDLHGLPALGETIYWYTGAVTYQLSAILILLQIALIATELRGARRNIMRMVLAAILLIAIAGMNEVAALLAIVGYAVLFAATAAWGSRRMAGPAAVLLGIALVAGIVVAAAPGNAVRSALYPVRHELIRSVGLTVLQTIRFGAEWASSGPLLLASLLYLPVAGELARSSPVFRGIDSRGAVVFAAGAFATIPIAVFPAYWATGMLGQHRTISVAYFVFLFAWFAALTVASGCGWLPRVPADRRAQAALALLLILALVFTGNGYRVAVDFARGRPSAFSREMSDRFAALRACASERRPVCELSPLTSPPDSLFVLDVSPNADNWVNSGFAAYFKVGRVVAAGRR